MSDGDVICVRWIPGTVKTAAESIRSASELSESRCTLKSEESVLKLVLSMGFAC